MKKIFIFIIFLVATLFLTSYSFYLPHHWDAFSYPLPGAMYSLNNNFTPFTSHSLGHPPFFFISLALTFWIFGYSLLVSHLYTIVLAFISIFFTYLIGEHLSKSTYVGITSSLLFLFSPLFVAQAGILTLSFPTTAFSLASIYYFLKKKRILFLISSGILALTSEHGVVVLFGLLFFPMLKQLYQLKLKRLFFHSIPFLVYILWLIASKLHWGWFFYWDHINKLSDLDPFTKVLQLFFGMRVLFLDDFKWILTALILLSAITMRRKYIAKKSQIVISLIISIGLYLVISNSYLLSNLSTNRFFSSLLIEIKDFSILFPLLLFIFLVYRKSFYKTYIKSDLFYLIPIFIPLLLLVATTLVLPRYLLPLFPLFYILSGISLHKIFKKYAFIPLIIILFLFTTTWTGQSDALGHVLESNKEYEDLVFIQKQAAIYLEENHPDARIMVAGFPLDRQLNYPYGGYVTKSLNAEFYNETKLKSKEGVDIFYYSPQSSDTKDIPERTEEFKITLLKKFEKNNKTAYIFRV